MHDDDNLNDGLSADSTVNRRDFLKGGSAATLMTLLGGTELFAQTNAPPSGETKHVGPKIKVGVIGLGSWGRDILNTLGSLEQADIAAICDHYPGALKRCASAAPGAAQSADYKAVLDNKDIRAVIVATPTHQHKDIALAALQAGKHVYCEAPLAATIEEARVIARAAREAPQQVFQCGMQMRADPQRHFLMPFIRSGAMGTPVTARAQWHKKQSWRFPAPTPEREKELNWRLDKSVSLGLIGELGCHQLDQACWFLNAHPVAVTGFGAVSFWKEDGREVPDTAQAVFEFPGGVRFTWDGTLANSFDGNYEMFYGSNAAIMLRDKAWMFEETDAVLQGWEIYAHHDKFYYEEGIALVMGASKSASDKAGKRAEEAPVTNTTLFLLRPAMETFLRNAIELVTGAQEFVELFGADDPKALAEALAKKQSLNKPAAGYLEGFQAVVMSVKANEAIATGHRVAFKPEWFELG